MDRVMRNMDRPTDRWMMDIQTDIWMDGWMNGLYTDKGMDGRKMNVGWMDRWNGCMDRAIMENGCNNQTTTKSTKKTKK